jgi:hypothetical protein
MPAPLKLILATALTAGSLTAQARLTAQQLAMRCDPPPGSLERLTRSRGGLHRDGPFHIQLQLSYLF